MEIHPCRNGCGVEVNDDDGTVLCVFFMFLFYIIIFFLSFFLSDVCTVTIVNMLIVCVSFFSFL